MKKNDFYRILSKLERNTSNKLKLEQYGTDIDTAYEVTEFIGQNLSFEGMKVADIGCGDGILGISAAVSGASETDMYDIDELQVEIAGKNVEKLGLKNVNIIKKDLFDIDKKYDIIVSNPPFGFQSNFSIVAFIKKVGEISNNFFFLYKDNLSIRKIIQANNLSISKLTGIKLQKSLYFHKKTSYTLPVILVYKLNV